MLWVGSTRGLVRLDTETGAVERYHPNPDNPEANEGNARNYDGFSEEERVRDLTLDPTILPNAAVR
jgi:hypothetical protein